MRKNTKKVIITCAPTGSIHTPSMSPYLPVTSDQIADGRDRGGAGGRVDPASSRAQPDGRRPEPLGRSTSWSSCRGSRQATDAVINVSTGGSATMSLDARLEGAKAARAGAVLAEHGAADFRLQRRGARVEHWQHEWERTYVEGSRGRIMYNDNAYIERIMREVGQAFGTRFEFECYDIGHLYTLAHFVDRKLGAAAVPDPGGVRHPGRDRRRPAQPGSHGDDRGQPVRRRLRVLGVRRGPQSAAFCTQSACWAATCGWAWKTASISAPASAPVQRGPGAQDSARSSSSSGSRSQIAPDGEARATLALKGRRRGRGSRR